MAKTKPGIQIELPGDITVTCPDDGGKLQNPVTVELRSGEITCYDVKSIVNAISMGLNSAIPKKQGDGKQGTGPAKSWADAEEYAAQYNKNKPPHEHITVDAARKVLAEAKKRQKLEAMLGVAPTGIAKTSAKKKKT
jgi:hypothetical protein